MLNLLLILAFVLPCGVIALNHYRPWVTVPFVNRTSLTMAQVLDCWRQAQAWIADPVNAWHIDAAAAARLTPRAIYLEEEPGLFAIGDHHAQACTEKRWYAPWRIRVARTNALALLQYEMQNLALMLAGRSTAGR